MTRNFVDIDVASLFFEDKEEFFDYETDKQKLIQHMEDLKNQSVEESTLYKKWEELRAMNNTKDIVKTGILKNILWAPTDIYNREQTIQEINDLRPKIVICEEGTEMYDTWNYLRKLCSSFELSTGIGRLIKILVFDETTNKVIGISSLASDVIAIAVRDEWIGWTKENKFEGGKLKNTAIGSTIVSTQPFGYNFLGGKLIASLLVTQDVRESWERKFGDKLVGLTTTSLYGGHSMYQRIPFWKELGKTAGRILLKPDDDHYEKWNHWLQDTHPEEYQRAVFGKAGTVVNLGDEWEWSYKGETMETAPTREELVNKLSDRKFVVQKDGVVLDLRGTLELPPSGPKQNVLNRVYRHLGMKMSDYFHGFKRGVYFAPIYENTREFLRGEITEEDLVLNPKLANDVDDVLDWWRKKAIRRYENLLDQDRIKPDHLYYRDMITMTSWEQVKKTYLNEVGR